MQTPVFLDHLPDADSVVDQKSTRYRLERAMALTQLLLDTSQTWNERPRCPACGTDNHRNRIFTQSQLEFRRCSGCQSVYAVTVPDQMTLDRLRLAAIGTEMADDGSREFEFTSLLNWISLTEARIGAKLDKVLDLRFATQAPGWKDAVSRLSHTRAWEFLPLTPDDENFTVMREALRPGVLGAILIPAELDRVADPAALLRAIRESAPKGCVIFATSSCADGLEYEILEADSPSFVPLDRLTLFSIKGFEALSRALGFEVLEVSTPGRRDAVILDRYFKAAENTNLPFWSSFFRDADKNRLRDLQILLQRSLKSGVFRFVLQT